MLHFASGRTDQSHRDVCNKHVLSHQSSPQSSGGEAPTRACQPCAERRVRCSRGSPCKQCVERRARCTYPASNSRGKRKRVVESDSVAAEHGSGLPSTSATQVGLCLPPAGQDITFDGPVETQPTQTPHTVVQTDKSSDGAADEPSTQYSEMLQQPIMDIAYGIVDGFNAQAMELLSINWLSPDYQAGLQLSEQLADMQNIFPAGGVGFPFSLGQAPAGYIDQASQIGQQSVMSQPTIPSQCRDAEILSIHSPQSPAVSHASGHSYNRFYVDGDGARASLRPPLPSDASSSHCVSDTHTHTNSAAGGGQACSVDGQLPVDLYQVLVDNLQAEFSNLTGNAFPPYEQVSQWVRLYLEQFHPTLPFLRRLELFNVNSDWVLLLAVVTLGAFLSTSSEAGKVRHSLMEILEQVVTHRHESVQSRQDIEKDWILPASARTERSGDLAIWQAAVLSAICLLHCGRKDKISRAVAGRHRLVDACHSLQLLSASPPKYSTGSAGDPRRWCRAWYQTQASIRLGLMIWASHPVEYKINVMKLISHQFLDFIIACEFHCRPLLQLADVVEPLPCSDHIWNSDIEDPEVLNSTTSKYRSLLTL